MVMKAARGLCAHDSAVCGTNDSDNWAIYSQDFIAQAQAALTECGALECLEALEGSVHFSDAVAYRDDTLSRALREWLISGEKIIAKVYGSAPE
jgi:hypothetical protein